MRDGNGKFGELRTVEFASNVECKWQKMKLKKKAEARSCGFDSHS